VLLALQALHGFDAVHHRHLPVHQHEVVGKRLALGYRGSLERLLAVRATSTSRPKLLAIVERISRAEALSSTTSTRAPEQFSARNMPARHRLACKPNFA
jgi:hypothetical protein